MKLTNNKSYFPISTEIGGGGLIKSPTNDVTQDVDNSVIKYMGYDINTSGGATTTETTEPDDDSEDFVTSPIIDMCELSEVATTASSIAQALGYESSYTWGLTLVTYSSPESEWLHTTATQEQIDAIANYLNDNRGMGCTITEEATTFADAAAKAFSEGGDVDFEENIIYDVSLNDYPCQKLVIQEAIGTCTPLTQTVLNAFEANDGTNLIFKVSDSISGNGSTSNQSIYNPITQTCDITITLRKSYVETATDLSIARTVIHENLHAVLVYMFEQNLLITPSGLPVDGFVGLVEAHINYLRWVLKIDFSTLLTKQSPIVL